MPVARLLAVTLLVTAVFGAPSQGRASSAGFRGDVEPISPSLARRMTGVSWHRGCPVGLGDLRVVAATYHGFDGRDRTGTLIVHRDVSSRILGVLRRLQFLPTR